MAVQAPERVTPPDALIISDPSDAASKLEKILITGDLKDLTPDQRVFYYREVCLSAGLNPLTRPFDYLSLNGKLVLYANRSCTDQVRRVNGIEVTKLEREKADDLAIVTAYGRDRSGRQDSAIGAVNIKGLQGEALANALMKAETKAKRRLTLSMSGLGLLDEIEVDSIPGAWRENVDLATGEVVEPKALAERLAEQAAAAEAELAAPDESSKPEKASDDQGVEPPPDPTPVADSPDMPGAASAEVVTEQPAPGALPVNEFLTWLQSRFIGISEARAAAKSAYGTDRLQDLTDAQRIDLRDVLAEAHKEE